MKRQRILILVTLLITPMLFSFIQIDGAVENPIVEVMTPEVIHNGAPAVNWNLEDILKENIEKLQKRYPKGFTKKKAKRGGIDWNEK